LSACRLHSAGRSNAWKSQDSSRTAPPQKHDAHIATTTAMAAPSPLVLRAQGCRRKEKVGAPRQRWRRKKELLQKYNAGRHRHAASGLAVPSSPARRSSRLSRHRLELARRRRAATESLAGPPNAAATGVVLSLAAACSAGLMQQPSCCRSASSATFSTLSMAR
jgi:hypothetical protein